jgi:hypothetical protein
MTTSFRPLHIRAVLKQHYKAVSRPREFGPDGWMFLVANVAQAPPSSILISCAEIEPGVDWIHASIANAERMPQYEDLKALHAAVFGKGYAYQVFTPPALHVNIHEHALHLWGRLDGAPAMPEFGEDGSI